MAADIKHQHIFDHEADKQSKYWALVILISSIFLFLLTLKKLSKRFLININTLNI